MDKVKYKYRSGSRNNSSNNENFVSKLLNSGIGKVSLLIISILMLLSVYRSIKQMGQKISLLKQAQQEVEDLRLDNLELSLELEDASNIDHLEKEARDRLNYGKENEIVFVIDDELLEIGKQRVQAILYPKSVVDDVDIFDEWVGFVIDGY